MLKTLKKLLSRTEGHETLMTPTNEAAHFMLLYGELEVGVLGLQDGVWRFEYTPAFKQQTDLKPLTDFPDLEKCYESEDLWPFFMLRIPSLEQPSVKRIIAEKELDKNNEVQLLKQFGKKTIANPFDLVPG